jgi:PHD/YefM family antitoxin component YafN of YafNO toxin-antitoxin module
MKTTNIVLMPKKIIKSEEMVIIPKKEYERLLAAQDDESDTLTPVQKRALRRAEKNFREGKMLTLDELKKRLGFKN